MRFALLGPLVVTASSGGRVTLGGSRLRILLATLLLHANIPVPTDELAEMVWDGSPPSAANSTLRSYVRRLRRALGDDATRIVARGPGYLIHVDLPELDLLEFEALSQATRAAVRSRDWPDASATATRALRLWRAAPLLDVPAEALRCEFVPRLERLRLQVIEDRFDAGLGLRQHQELISQLQDMAAQYPLHERFRSQLMLALASTGRQAEALCVYQDARSVLIDELGIEPGPELRDVQRRILAGDEAQLTAQKRPSEAPVRAAEGAAGPVSADPASAGPVSVAPAQLPADNADFTGRETQASYIGTALADHDVPGGPGRVRVIVVTGSAGFGKTTLAVHVAHQVRDLFPDGQLYVHLSGASGQPAVPGEVLARVLRDLGVDGGKIPAGDEERAALYRTLLTGRRALILLDDAKDVAQVRPLLPGSASCAVLVTTRSMTPYLVSTEFVDLGALAEPEALELFSRMTGDVRVAAEPEATTEILRACAGMPLAVRICAARLATRPRWRISTMAARLRDEQRRLDELQIGDLEIRASFHVSYDSLRTGRHHVDPSHAFRLLGLWQGQRISLPAAAALIGEREEHVAGALEALVDANLLESPEPDWYQLHDLLRIFAIERAQAEETEQARLQAEQRLLQWYLGMTVAAAETISPYRYGIPEEGKKPVPGLPLDSVKDALAWYDGEQANVIAAIRQAAVRFHDCAWRLATALFPLFTRRHHWTDCVTAHRIAVISARTAGSPQGEAWALQNLGEGLLNVGETEAFARLEEAFAIRRESGDLAGEAQTAVSIACACYNFRGPQEAYDRLLRCLELLREVGNPALLGVGLNNLGEYCRALGRMDEATEFLREALGVWAAIGGHGQGFVMESLGRIYLESGRLPEAIASLSEAHRLHVVQGQLLGQAVALRHLGEAQHSAGQTDRARESLVAALALFESLKSDTEIKAIHVALAALGNPR
jgi:DNA-binding SARP family transcriptional activator/tetratricopeptide (TPR) repeat protein